MKYMVMKHTMLHSIWFRWGCLLAAAAPTVAVNLCSLRSAIRSLASSPTKLCTNSACSISSTKRNASLAERPTQAPAGVVSPSMASGKSEPTTACNWCSIPNQRRGKPTVYLENRWPWLPIQAAKDHQTMVHLLVIRIKAMVVVANAATQRKNLSPALSTAGLQLNVDCGPETYAVPRQTDPQEYLFDVEITNHWFEYARTIV